MALKLLIENPTFELDYILEEKNKNEPQSLYIKGPFLMAEEKNKNGRIYPLHELKNEVDRYITEMIKTNRALGELNHPSCHLGSAEILTNEGFIQFKDLSNNASVYTLDIDSDEIVLQRINKKIVSKYDGYMYHIKGRNIDTTITPTHRLPIERRNGDREYVTVEELYKNRNAYSKSKLLKVGTWDVDSPEYYTLKGDDYIYADRCKGNITNDIDIKYETFVKFLGIYLAEGHCSNPNAIHQNGYSVHISQKKSHTRDMIRSMLEEFPSDIEWTETDVDFRVCDKRLHNLLYPLGDCYNKYIPTEFKNLSASLLEELVYWFNIGDGRFSTTSHEHGYIQRNIFTVSKRLIDDIQECLLKSGGSGNITTIITECDYKFAGHIILACNNVPLYQLSIATSKNIYLDPRFLKIERVELGQDTVYCVNVDNGNFYCRDNSKSFWSGNSCDVNPERACHMINDLWQESNIFYGKSKILNTPMGNIVKSLIMEGVQLGVSSRALGKLSPTSLGNSVSNLHLICCDVVHDPSVPTAFVDGILESKDWIINADGSIAEDMHNSITVMEQSIATLPTKNVNEYLRDTIIDFLNSIK